MAKPRNIMKSLRVKDFLQLGSLFGSTQDLSGAGAVDVVSMITFVTTTGANALTLADGSEGQIKIIKMVVDGGDGTLTPSHFLDGSTLTFDNTDYAILVFNGTNWCLISGNAAVA